MLRLWPITSCPVHSAHRNTFIPFCTLSPLRDCHPFRFSKQHHDLSLPSLVAFSRALVTALDALRMDMDLCPEVDAARWLNLGVTDVIHGLPSGLYLLV